ncbi:MAG: tRNA (adenosine(37)-N6)-threonylcarbamoyltransferase complex ATPase subunit type 1 TsaE [Oscillospiraceae bacterium]|nr:tRNA (adenosine(37)-N6)-threonylcarbamoyltransferase complex ATPase subunit type 1 TsaE [Oscillospiraceae bacterium]
MEKYITTAPSETEHIAEQFAARLRPKDGVFLIGDMGAGKTRFTKGLARGLGITDNVTSPTFAVAAEYYPTVVGNTTPLFHFDFYRLETAADIDAIGFYDYINRGGICVMEWADGFGLETEFERVFRVGITARGEVREIVLDKIIFCGKIR